MKFRIHFELSDGSEDYIDIEGETVEEIRTKADQEVIDRRGHNAWSEEL